MTMRTAEFSLPPLVNLKPAFGAKQPNVLPQGVNLTNLIPTLLQGLQEQKWLRLMSPLHSEAVLL
ncbi:MAG: hypothetical protein H2174_01090 [Vampirovibrio sp.]|nr:hypothetical protein [Vampirovibrio sp.]